jgi:prophage DNA circulation protein
VLKPDLTEAEGVVQRTLTNLLGVINDKGSTGVNAKVIVGWVAANSLSLLYYDQMGEPLDACFESVRQTGTTVVQMEEVRRSLTAESLVTSGASMIRDRSIQMALAQEAKIISAMTFTSRQDVDDLIVHLKEPFDSAEETAANTMDATDYQAIISLRSSIVNYLVQTSRPLPSMLAYQFAKTLPSLVISHKLYGDASRYDEIRAENKIIHPAFCPPLGQALSL